MLFNENECKEIIEACNNTVRNLNMIYIYPKIKEEFVNRIKINILGNLKNYDIEIDDLDVEIFFQQPTSYTKKLWHVDGQVFLYLISINGNGTYYLENNEIKQISNGHGKLIFG